MSRRKKMAVCPLGRIWTTKERATVREHAGKLDAAIIGAMIDRSRMSVLMQISRMGLSKHRHWSAAEDRRLTNLWDETIHGSGLYRAIGAQMGRTDRQVYRRAIEVGLPMGIPQGYAGIGKIADEVGVECRLMMRICRQMGVKVHRLPSDPFRKRAKVKRGRRVLFVDSAEALVAAEKWVNETEAITPAAIRRGVSDSWLRQRVAMLVAEPRKYGCTWRVPSKVIDDAVRLERASQVARRTGETEITVCWALRRGGAPRAKRVFYVLPEEADRMIAEWKALPRHRRRLAAQSFLPQCDSGVAVASASMSPARNSSVAHAVQGDGI